MKKILILATLLICKSSFSQQNFEGIVEYEIQHIKPDFITDSLWLNRKRNLHFKEIHYYGREGKYKIEFCSLQDTVVQLFDTKEKMNYIFSEGDKNILKTTLDFEVDSNISVEKLTEQKEVLDYNCKCILFNNKLSTVKICYDSVLYLSPEDYKSIYINNFNKVILNIKSVPLYIEEKSITIIKKKAISIKKLTIEDSNFYIDFFNYQMKL